MPTRPCTRCRGKTEPTVLESAGGEADSLAVQLRNMPVLTCKSGHRQFFDADFPRRLVERLMGEDESKLPAGEEKGLLRKRYHCGGCGAELAPQAERKETFPFDVALPQAAPFRVELTAPVYRCPTCSREQLHSLKELRSRTPAALAEAFRAADIPPA